MRCTKCGTKSTTSRKFCAACGSPLSRRCPKCGAENAPSSAFCEDCGTALAGHAASASASSPQTASTAPNVRVTPEQPAGDPIDGERKTVTALFADIKGSTELQRDLDPEDARAIVDLLFFPTGGGKTEAYLGLVAFTLVLRRLRNPGISSAGVSVLMRYTLRLLTLEQLARAATMICALELEREKDVAKFGQWPFEIGLWVGMAATPNRMGRKEEPDQSTARARTLAFKNDDHRPSPIPLENCPWCGQKFTRNSFHLKPNSDQPRSDDRVRKPRLRVQGRSCAANRSNRRTDLPTAAMLHRRHCGQVCRGSPGLHIGALFGKVERFDREGFYGPCDPGDGAALEEPLLPPDLIIQDELHLIFGPLGTMAGLYETAVDALSTRDVSGKRVGPKIVASTATVRRADAQARALFARSGVEVFPPPGIDRRDSFFALTVPASTRNPRLYAGIAAQGRSLKVVLFRSYLALLAAAQRKYAAEGGDKNLKNPADPYMTLVGYFGSLRELGGRRRIIEDEVNSRLQSYGSRKRIGEAEGLSPTAK
jgi:hypothetical protein